MDKIEISTPDRMLTRLVEIHNELCTWIALVETYTEQHYLQEVIIGMKKVIEIASLKQEAKEH